MPFKKKKIAIVGMACRLPGDIQSPDDYWQVLKDGSDVVTSVDSSRWSTDFYQHPDKKEPGKSYTFAAGVLSQIDQFDADFFGISPREAAQMDPQQRLLLELTWEALENGRQLPKNLAGTKCAVYIGIASTDYAHRRMDDLSSLDPYSMTGNTASIASNRISYLFDLHGPSVSVDTACSSSLVALHQACNSIWSGDAPMAIAGGVNMLLHPFGFVGFSKASMLSPRGRCHAFDDNGDGYVRSEGSGILFLKPLDDAIADGDPIQAIIVESGINCDGHTNGISLPSATGQGELLTEVYGKAGVDLNDLSYIEAHGTGTAIGDPIEASAIANALATSRNKPLPIGSAKTNVGHLETASGMAGVLKIILSLKHRALPKSLHFDTPNKHIDFKAANLKVVTRFTPLATSPSPLLMGVNSFGFGGANAHVLLEEYIQGDTAELHALQAAGTPPLFLSANSKTALQAVAQQYLELFPDKNSGGIEDTEDAEDRYYDLAFSAAHYRQPLKYGLAINGVDHNDIRKKLSAYIKDESPSGVTAAPQLNQPTVHKSKTKVNTKPKLALVFSGNGSQWQGMGCELLKTEAMFRTLVETIDTLLTAHSEEPISLMDEFMAPVENSRLEYTEVAQLLLFTLQVGMIHILRAHGLKADACIGHSVGEVSAAWAAGALTLEQAVEVIYERSHAQGETKGSGRMAATGMGKQAIAALLDSLNLQDAITIAGINSPHATTLSGALTHLEQLSEVFADKNIFYRILDLDYGFHSPEMLPIENRVKTTLHGLSPQKGDTHFVSTVTGSYLDGDNLDATYWWENIRKPVLFHKAMDTLVDDGFSVFFEVGPHPILRSYINECCRTQKITSLSLATQTRTSANLSSLLDGLYGGYLAGCPLDMSVLFPKKGNTIELPNYPWQREKHWYTLTPEGADLVNRAREHPLLGYRIKTAQAQWENQLDTHKLPFLKDHVVDGGIVFPAAGYVEMALAASALHFGCADSTTDTDNTQSHELENIEIKAPIVVDSAKTTRFTLLTDDGSFTIESRDRMSDTPWTLNVVGRVLGKTARTAPPPLNVKQMTQQANLLISSAGHYQLTESVGLSYGSAFQRVDEVWISTHEKISAKPSARPQTKPALKALASLKKPTEIITDFNQYELHPTLLDAGFQILVDVFSEDIHNQKQAALIPVQIGKLYRYKHTDSIAYIQVNIRKQSPQSVVADFLLLDKEGTVLVELLACRFKGVQLTKNRKTDPACYVFKPLLMPSKHQQKMAPLYNTSTLADSVNGYLSSLKRNKHYQHISPLLDVLITAFAWQTIRHLHPSSESFNMDDLIENDVIKPQYKPLLYRLLWILKADDLASCNASQWHISTHSDLPEADDIWLSILGDSPAYLPELVLLGRCGSHLADVMQGKHSAKSLLQPEKSSIQAHWYHASQSYLPLNNALCKVVEEVVATWPPNRRLRILEIGGGDAELTHQLLPLLPPQQCDYLFTDASEDAVTTASFELEEWAFLTTQTLDIEHYIGHAESINTKNDEKNIDGKVKVASYDLIIASHTLYQAGNLSTALSNAQQLLAPQGMLLLLERPPNAFTDMTLGLDPQWWVHTEEAHQPLSLLLSQNEWENALQRENFENTTIITEPESLGNEGAFLMMATASLNAEKDNNPEQDHSHTWMLLTDSSDPSQLLAKELSARLIQRGQHTLLVELDEIAETDEAFKQLSEMHYHVNVHNKNMFDALFESLKTNNIHINHVVHMAGLQDEITSSLSPLNLDPLALQQLRCVSTSDLVQSIERHAVGTQLWLITTHASVTDQPSRTPNPAQAPLWGLGRVIMNEHPDVNCKLIDLQCEDSSKVADVLLAELLDENTEENEILLSDNTRHVMRMHLLSQQEIESTCIDSGQRQPDVTPLPLPLMELSFKSPGPLKNLYWKTLPEQSLADDEIEIQPYATGLNFRDVMYAMGMLSDEAVENGFAGPTLGMELSGKVISVGNNITDFKAGDEVIGFAPACFSTRVTTQTTAIAHKPSDWSFEEAATVPTTFFTVYYALHHLAQLRKGEKILIHGAAGGVGIAAIQFARYKGAEIFATAGSDEKRDFVRLMGADHVLDSRSLAFADDIMRITHDEGIDIVLNSLAGEAINRNLSILKPFGRFLELGKRDYYENSKIGLRPFRNNISYFGIDADQLLIERPQLAAELFIEMMGLFTKGVLRPLPHRVFPAMQIEDAFRYMQQSRHIGKVVVSFSDDLQTLPTPEPLVDVSVNNDTTATQAKAKALVCDPEASYLITGGLSGFGLETAHWLADKGATTLILVSRSGQAPAESEERLVALQNRDIHIEIRPCDVVDEQAVNTLFDALSADFPPLKGIVLGAMVLDDGLIRNLSHEQFNQVLAPKILGSWHIHQASIAMHHNEKNKHNELDFFVMYSSATTYLGNPGQANYVAANLFLESLANYRRAKGLTATYAAWGAIDDVGVLARNENVKEALQSRLGGSPLSSKQALVMLEKLIVNDRTGAAIIDLDWNVIQRMMPSASSPKYSEQQVKLGDMNHLEDIQSLITGMTEEETQQLVTDLLLTEIEQILRLPREKLAINSSVFDLGMDSLMGMELVLAIEERFAVKLPVMALTEGATISRIAERICSQLLNSNNETELIQTRKTYSKHKDAVAIAAARHAKEMNKEELDKITQALNQDDENQDDKNNTRKAGLG